jgi:hypothetical protein
MGEGWFNMSRIWGWRRVTSWCFVYKSHQSIKWWLFIVVIAKTSSKHFLNWSYEFQYSCMLWLMYFMLNAPLTITLVYFMHMNSFCVSCLNYYFMYTFRCRWTIFAFLSYNLLGLSSQTSFLTCNLYGYTINSI